MTRRLLTLLAALVFVSAAAFATPMIFFEAPGGASPGAGSVAYAGASAPVIGTNIVIDAIRTQELPGAPSSPYTCTGCVLNFTSGAFVNYTTGLYTFASGGSISITGTGPGSSSTTLATGSFTGPVTVIESGGSLKVAAGAVLDTKDPGLVATLFPAYGALNPWVGTLNVNFVAAGGGTAFTSTSIDVSTRALRNEFIPEPTSVVLFGTVATGLLAGIIARRRRAA